VTNKYSKIVSAFHWLVAEMDRRLKKFSETGVRDIDSYNEVVGGMGEPRILAITYYNFFGVEAEDCLAMLAGQGQRAGIHNIVVIEHTNAKIFSNSIKNNIPARVTFRLSSAGESKAIDILGAETLEPGEIIYKPNFGESVKLKSIFTPEENVKEVVEAVKKSI